MEEQTEPTQAQDTSNEQQTNPAALPADQVFPARNNPDQADDGTDTEKKEADEVSSDEVATEE